MFLLLTWTVEQTVEFVVIRDAMRRHCSNERNIFATFLQNIILWGLDYDKLLDNGS